jgi:hypothetical protein
MEVQRLMRWRRTFMAEVTRTLQQLGMKICPVCGLAKSLNVNDFPVLLANGRLPSGVDALGEYHEADLTFAVRMDCITCGHLMLFDAQRYRTGDEKILVLGLAEDEESPSGELPPLRRLPYQGPGGTAARTGHSMMIGPGGPACPRRWPTEGPHGHPRTTPQAPPPGLTHVSQVAEET